MDALSGSAPVPALADERLVDYEHFETRFSATPLNEKGQSKGEDSQRWFQGERPS